MRTEVRFLLAIGLMIVVLVGTNMLFPPAPPPELAQPADSGLVVGGAEEGTPPQGEVEVPSIPDLTTPTVVEPPAEQETIEEQPAEVALVPEERVIVEGPLYRFEFSSHGARLLSAQLPEFASFRQEGSVELVHEGELATLGQRLLVSGDTIDLRRVPFVPSTLSLDVTSQPETLRFTYDHPTADFGIVVDYTFDPNAYAVVVSGTVRGVDGGVLFTDMGSGVAMNAADDEEDRRLSAYVFNNTEEGITAVPITSVEEDRVDEGPLFWAVFKSKFFMFGMLAGTEPDAEDDYLAGLIATVNDPEAVMANVTVSQPFGPGGRFAYRIYAGPQDFRLLSDQGHDLEDANPYGWKFMRPLIQPFTGMIIGVLNWMHDRFNMAYGWVLILFGVMMRVVFFPLYHKSMKAQLKNMAVQPLLKEIQTKYKDNPEKMQKELMKLYKEHGFNPLAGCLPMLLPWPVLVALFFVFQNTIELRGVPFLWFPDLSQPDPLYVLPVLLGVSMFLLQWVGFRSIDQVNPQMKMMMWFMPIFLVFIFFRLPSGLNLYYLTANVASLPQQFWISNERQKARSNAPAPKADSDKESEPAAEPAQKRPARRKRKKPRKR